jgi:hypothetical protein
MADYDHIVTADTHDYRADETEWPTADGGLIGNVISAEVFEPVGGVIHADTTFYSADETVWPTADGGLLDGAADSLDAQLIAAGAAILVEAADATDLLDAKVIAASRFGVVLRPAAVVGYGHGVLPELEGEGHGVVGVAGDSIGALSLSGEAHGEVEDDLELMILLLLAA